MIQARKSIRLITLLLQVFENRDRLSIEDPNNSANDISGGTKEISLIFRAFRHAYWSLKDRVDWMNDNNQDASILEAIIAANYDEYIEQRYQLRHVFDTAPQFAKYRQPPPPPPPLPVGESPPPPPPTGPRSMRSAPGVRA